jgi:proteasome lid subunit RPN8/RPN11
LSINALRVTHDVLRDVVAVCRSESPNEACGFIVGDPKTMVGSRIIIVPNIHQTPEVNYLMGSAEILAAYKDADDAGEEIIAVYHSHTATPPILSSGRPDADVENAHDTTLAYLVVSTRDIQRPTALAWRIATPFVGMRVAEEIPLRPTAIGDSLGFVAPVLPWALTPGNVVEITYRRARGEGQIVFTATVTDGDRDTVMLKPRIKSGVNSLPLERIVAVQVISESDLAKDVRREVIACLRHAAAAVSSGDCNLVEQLIAVPAAAFPAAIETSIR